MVDLFRNEMVRAGEPISREALMAALEILGFNPSEVITARLGANEIEVERLVEREVIFDREARTHAFITTTTHRVAL
jgi:hypothetical protein